MFMYKYKKQGSSLQLLGRGGVVIRGPNLPKESPQEILHYIVSEAITETSLKWQYISGI